MSADAELRRNHEEIVPEQEKQLKIMDSREEPGISMKRTYDNVSLLQFKKDHCEKNEIVKGVQLSMRSGVFAAHGFSSWENAETLSIIQNDVAMKAF